MKYRRTMERQGIAIMRIEIKCAFCGAMFKRETSRVKRSIREGKVDAFCSQSCAAQARAKARTNSNKSKKKETRKETQRDQKERCKELFEKAFEWSKCRGVLDSTAENSFRLARNNLERKEIRRAAKNTAQALWFVGGNLPHKEQIPKVFETLQNVLNRWVDEKDDKLQQNPMSEV